VKADGVSLVRFHLESQNLVGGFQQGARAEKAARTGQWVVGEQGGAARFRLFARPEDFRAGAGNPGHRSANTLEQLVEWVVLPAEQSCPSRASPLEDDSHLVFARNQVMAHCKE